MEVDMAHALEIDETDYQALEKSAHKAGISVSELLKRLIDQHRALMDEARPRTPGRWARVSERIRRNPPLQGASEYIYSTSLEMREDFSVTEDDKPKP